MTPEPRPTIRQLEEMTGFSRGTISRALHGYQQIEPATRDKILTAAQKIGYVPQRGLARPQLTPTCRYGVLLPNLNNPYYAELVQCLDIEVRREQRMIVLAMHHHDTAMVENLLRHWLSGETDGIAIDPPDLKALPRVLDYLRSRDLPIVFLHGRPSEDFCLVHYSRLDSYRRAMRQLHELGHRHIAYIGMSAHFARQTDSFLEYESFVKSLGQSIDENLLHFGANNAATGYQGLMKFSTLRKRPTAVICFNDIMACGVGKAARELKVRIPEDLSLVGSDDIGEVDRLGYTTIHTDRAAMAREVYRLLEEQRQQGRRLSEAVPIPCELIVRGSVALASEWNRSLPVLPR